MLSVEQLARRVGAVRAHCRQQEQQQQRCELVCVTVSLHTGLHPATVSQLLCNGASHQACHTL